VASHRSPPLRLYSTGLVSGLAWMWPLRAFLPDLAVAPTGCHAETGLWRYKRARCQCRPRTLLWAVWVVLLQLLD
jgi:hypothetical protein